MAGNDAAWSGEITLGSCNVVEGLNDDMVAGSIREKGLDGWIDEVEAARWSTQEVLGHAVKAWMRALELHRMTGSRSVE